MATGWSSAAAQVALQDLADTYDFVKLHVGDPGSAGTANPAVETDRVQATWAAASGGTLTTSAQLQWTSVAGTEDYTHFSVWDASTAGAFGFSGTITANAVTTGDTFTIAAGDLDVTLVVAS